MEKHVIFGANGPIGSYLAEELETAGKEIVKVGRRALAEKNYQQADALNIEQVQNVVEGASHIYITVGLAYKTQDWQRDWPIIIKNMIQVAREENARLIFFDNIYMYGPTLQNPIKENHLLQPSSNKGKVRHQHYKQLKEAMEDTSILIVRSPDFFGPRAANNSVLYVQFLENMLKGENPKFIG